MYLLGVPSSCIVEDSSQQKRVILRTISLRDSLKGGCGSPLVMPYGVHADTGLEVCGPLYFAELHV